MEMDKATYDRSVRSRSHSGTTDQSNLKMTNEVSQQPLLMQGAPLTLLQAGARPSKKTISIVQMFLLNAVVCGVEICACAGFTYIPPMLLKAGYTEENMSIILGLGPLLGFFLVPVIGRASDRCQSKYGRRKPFILFLSLILIISLITIPWIDVVISYLFGVSSTTKSITLTCMTVGVVLLDFTSQACLTPCEALLSDASKDTDQSEKVFIIYSLMVSFGGLIGYLITALDWNTTLLGAYFGNQERTVFTILVILLTLMLSATVMVAQEKPLFRPGETKTEPQPTGTNIIVGNGSTVSEAGFQMENETKPNGDVAVPQKIKQLNSNSKRPIPTQSPQRTPRMTIFSFPKVILKSIISIRLVAAIFNLFCLMGVTLYDNFPEPIKRLYEVPFVIRHLAVANFCSWTAVMGFNLFFTDFVGNAVYHGNPNAPEDSFLRNKFDEGVRMGSWGLLLHCITSAVYALFVERLVDRYGCKRTYMMGMASFSFAMLGMVLVKESIFVIIMAAFTGFGYATLTTIPFIIVSKYHEDKETFFFDVPSSNAAATPHGIATDMATLDSAYFLSQVVLSCIMGYIVHMTGTVLSYMATAGFMGILACYFISKIFVTKQEVLRYRQVQMSVDL